MQMGLLPVIWGKSPSPVDKYHKRVASVHTPKGYPEGSAFFSGSSGWPWTQAFLRNICQHTVVWCQSFTDLDSHSGFVAQLPFGDFHWLAYQ